MQGYYTRIPINGELSRYVRSFHIADNAIQNLTIESPPTGYPLLAHIWHGLKGVEVDGTMLPSCPLPINLIAGQLQKVQATVHWSGGMGHAVVEFTATGLYELTGIAGDRIVNTALPVSSIDRGLDDLMNAQFKKVPSELSYFDAFVNTLTSLTDKPRPVPDYISEAVRLIETEGGAVKLSDVCRKISIGERMLHKKFKEIVGLSPKYFCKIVQFNNVGHIVLSGDEDSIATLAAEAGFYDQSHFTKVFHEFVLASPREFLASEYAHVSTFLRHLSTE